MSVRQKLNINNNNLYFITFTILNWQKIFTEKKYIDLVYKWFDYTKDKYGNKIYGYVVMPNHVHCIMFLSDTSPNLSVLIQNAKRFIAYGVVKFLTEDHRNDLLNIFSEQADRKNKAKHKIFKDRYDSQVIESRRYFLQKLNYIHNNPCQEKWQLAKNPEDYLYSSASNYFLGSGIFEVNLMNF